MTYQPSLDVVSYSGIKGLALVTFAYGYTSSVGRVIGPNSVATEYGTAFATISSGSLVLEAGFVYYLEASIQTADNTLPPNPTDYVEIQWYDSGYVGRKGRSYQTGPLVGDNTLTVTDEKAIALIDTTQGAKSVSLRVVSYSNIPYINSFAHSTYAYAGFSRATLIKLSPSS